MNVGSLFNKEDLEKQIIPGLSLQTFLVFGMLAEKELKEAMEKQLLRIKNFNKNGDGSVGIEIVIPANIVEKWNESMQMIKESV